MFDAGGIRIGYVLRSASMLVTGTFEQYTLLDQLSDAEIAKTQPCDDAMFVDEPVKPVAGSSKHPDDTDVIDGELIY